MSMTEPPGATTAPTVVTLSLLTMPRTGERSSVRRTRSCADLIVSSSTARSPLDLARSSSDCARKVEVTLRDARFGFGELPAHVGVLAVEPQHLDFGDDFLGVEIAGQRHLAIEQGERAGQLGLGLREHVDFLRDLAHARLVQIALGVDRLAGGGDELVGEHGRGAGDFGFEAGDTRRHGAAALAYLAELRGEAGVVDAHQRLAFAHDRAFLRQDFRDDAAFQRLHDLHGARGDHAAIAALHFVEHGKVRPDQRHREESERGRQQHARGARGAQLHRGADVVGEGEIRPAHWRAFPSPPRRRAST